MGPQRWGGQVLLCVRVYEKESVENRDGVGVLEAMLTLLGQAWR